MPVSLREMRTDMTVPEPLASLEQQLAQSRAEVARLELAITQHPEWRSPPSRSISHPSSPGSSPTSSPVTSPVSQSRSILDEPWAVPPTPEMCQTLAWLQNWHHSFPAPSVLGNDSRRARAAEAVAASQEGDQQIFSRLCQLARNIFHVQFAAVNIVAQDRVHFRGCDIVHPPLMDMRGAPRELSICNYTVAKGRTLVISDMQLEPATKDNPICTDYGCRFYAGSPLTMASGLHLGTFCLMDTAPNHQFNEGAQALLELLATTAVTMLELTRLKQSRERFHQHVLANISHELRTPIHGIIGLCDLVSESRELSLGQSDNLGNAKGQAREMLSLVNDMLDFVKLDAGQLSLNRELLHPHRLLTDTTALLEPAAAARLVNLRVFQPYSAKMSCLGDERRVAQVLTILLSNAIKFSKPHHNVEVHVTHHSSRPELLPSHPDYHHFSPAVDRSSDALSTAADTFFLYIRVADAGSGISEKRLPHVFDKFYEEELQPFAPRNDGVGLGLAVCRLLTELMDGQLLVESLAKHGSVFHVVLPLLYDQLNNAETGITEAERDELASRQSPISPSLQLTTLQSPDKEPSRRLTNFNNQTDPNLIAAAALRRQSSLQSYRPAQSTSALPTDGSVSVKVAGQRFAASPAVASSAAGRPVRSVVSSLAILIVDDNIINLKVAARFLNTSGHECVCVQSGAEALELVQSRPVDVVLMDLQMPEMDGLTCTRRMRQLETDGKLQQRNGLAASGGGHSSSHGRLPIIAVTASEGAGVPELCVAEGMDACIFKPFNKQQILAMIAVVLAHRSGE